MFENKLLRRAIHEAAKEAELVDLRMQTRAVFLGDPTGTTAHADFSLTGLTPRSRATSRSWRRRRRQARGVREG